MIFMSQSGLADRTRDADWDRWYVEHLRTMVSVEGVDSAQRFKTASEHHSPSLALYTVRSQAVFDDAHYQRIRGLGEFLPLIDRRHYHRNLFSGLDAAPAVRPDEVLLVWDASAPQQSSGIAFAWLQAVAIDRSTPYRGIAVVTPAAADAAKLPPQIARYVPATEVFVKGR
jgi:hypothetical protein